MARTVVVFVCTVCCITMATGGGIGISYLGYSCFVSPTWVNNSTVIICGLVSALAVIIDIAVFVWAVITVVILIRRGAVGCTSTYDCFKDRKVGAVTARQSIKGALRRNDTNKLKEVITSSEITGQLIWKAYIELHPPTYYLQISYPQMQHVSLVYQCLFIATPCLRTVEHNVKHGWRKKFFHVLEKHSFPPVDLQNMLYVLLMTGHASIEELPQQLQGELTDDILLISIAYVTA